jgi:hypothetical protein
VSTRGPDFDELVGADLEAAERERLRRVHELLLAAGPPPGAAPEAPPLGLARRRAWPARLALAAALAVAAFSLGALVGDRLAGPDADFEVVMTGTRAAAGASASIDVFPLDAAGNWPMEVSVRGLGPDPRGRLYELWLTRGGKPAALCGYFRAEPDGTTVVPMNAPYLLREFDGWVVVVEGTEEPLLTT